MKCCWICLEDESDIDQNNEHKKQWLEAVCLCKGSTAHVHSDCLGEWISKGEAMKICPACRQKFKVQLIKTRESQGILTILLDQLGFQPDHPMHSDHLKQLFVGLLLSISILSFFIYLWFWIGNLWLFAVFECLRQTLIIIRPELRQQMTEFAQRASKILQPPHDKAELTRAFPGFLKMCVIATLYALVPCFFFSIYFWYHFLARACSFQLITAEVFLTKILVTMPVGISMLFVMCDSNQKRQLRENMANAAAWFERASVKERPRLVRHCDHCDGSPRKICACVGFACARTPQSECVPLLVTIVQGECELERKFEAQHENRDVPWSKHRDSLLTLSRLPSPMQIVYCDENRIDIVLPGRKNNDDTSCFLPTCVVDEFLEPKDFNKPRELVKKTNLHLQIKK